MTYKGLNFPNFPKCPTTLIFGEMQIKTTMSITSRQSERPSLRSPQTRNAGEGVEKREASYTPGGNGNGRGHRGEQQEVP